MTTSDITHIHDFICGYIAGCAGVTVGHPFDTLKVQLQVQAAENKYSSLREVIQTVKKQNISKGYFRGLSWPLFASGIINSTYFGVYGYMLKVLEGDKRGNDAPPYLKILLAGCAGGIIQLIPACPAEVIKVVLQSQIPHGDMSKSITGQKFYKGPLEGARDIIRLRGVSGLYRGLPTQFVRDVPANSMYFLSFEFLTYECAKRVQVVPSTVVNFVAGGIAGVLSWAIIIPFDVVKSRLQADTEGKRFKGFFDCARKSYNDDGIRIFFRGVTMTSLRAFPVNAVTLMVYAECMKLFGEEVNYAS